MSVMKRFTTARMAAALLLRVPYGRCRREALFTNITTYCDPPRDVGKGPAAISMCVSSIGLLARALVWWTVGARFPFAIEHAEHETSSPVKGELCCLAVASNTLVVWAWARETRERLMSMSLPCFNMPGFRAAAAKEQPDLIRVFLPNSSSPNTELTGGEGIRYSKSSYAASAPETFDAPKNCKLFGTLGGQDGTQLLRGQELDYLVLGSFLY